MSESKITKKELQAKIENLEKELSFYKCRTQLARNYNILQKQYDDLHHKLKYARKAEEDFVSSDEESV